MGRFINADAFASTGQGVLGNNMFAYCGNNPAIYVDPYGYCASTIALQKNNPTYIGLCPVCGGSSEGGGGGGVGILIVLKDVANSLLAGAEAIAEPLVKAAALSFTVAGTYAQDSSLLKLADQSPPDGQYQYWEAFWYEKKVLVGRGISLWEASLRVACGQNVMCANQDAARWLVKINGYHNAVGPEVGRGEGFFWHYHPHRDTEVHIWFYGGVDP